MRLNVYKFFGKSEFLKNVFVLVSGNTVAQAIPILISPVLTRLYSPENFGVLSLYISVVSVITVIAAGRYELAIMLPEEDKEAINIVALCILIVIIVSFLTFILSFILGNAINNFFGSSKIIKWLPLLPVSIFFIGIYQVFNYWLTRKKRFKSSSTSKMAQSISGSAFKVSFGILGFKEFGLIVGEIIGSMLGFLVIITQSLKSKNVLSNISLSTIISKAKRYKDFPKYYLITALMDSITVAFPLFILSKSYGDEITGYYGLMLRTISIPSGIIAYSVSQVYFQKIVEMRIKKENIKAFLFKTIRNLSVLLLPIFLILLLAGPFLFSFVFGEKWIYAGEYARILSIAFYIRFIVSPLSMIFAAFERVRTGALWQIICFFTTITTLYFAASCDIKIFLVIFAIHDIILYGFYLYLIIKLSDLKEEAKKII